jgi:hypothetical protein
VLELFCDKLKLQTATPNPNVSRGMVCENDSGINGFGAEEGKQGKQRVRPTLDT